MATDDIYRRAKEELTACLARAERLRTFLATYDELKDGANRPPVTPQPQAGGGTLQSPVALAAAGQAAVGETGDPARPYDYSVATSPNDMDDIVESVLREAGRPMPRGQLFEAAVARGVVIVGAKPINTFSTRLNRSSRFVSVFNKGYWLADMPVPDEAGQPEVEGESENQGTQQTASRLPFPPTLVAR